MLLKKMPYSDSYLLFHRLDSWGTWHISRQCTMGPSDFSSNTHHKMFILSFVIYVSYINSIAVRCYNSFSKYCLQMDI